MLDTQSSLAGGSWLPPLDVYETKTAFVVVVDVPGVPSGALEVTLDAGVLMVRGERKFHSSVTEDSFHRVERRFGSFARSVSLPSARVDHANVTARMADGVVTIEVPKSESAQPRRIDVVETSPTIDADSEVGEDG